MGKKKKSQTEVIVSKGLVLNESQNIKPEWVDLFLVFLIYHFPARIFKQLEFVSKIPLALNNYSFNGGLLLHLLFNWLFYLLNMVLLHLLHDDSISFYI